MTGDAWRPMAEPIFNMETIRNGKITADRNTTNAMTAAAVEAEAKRSTADEAAESLLALERFEAAIAQTYVPMLPTTATDSTIEPLSTPPTTTEKETAGTHAVGRQQRRRRAFDDDGGEKMSERYTGRYRAAPRHNRYPR